jgi:hypothetical protein
MGRTEVILHPGVLSLILGLGVTLLLLLFASALGITILRRWDVNSSSEEQLRLERRTYLVSTLVQYGLLFEVVSVFLFIYTADDLHTLLVGAMCATGTLNANSYGFPALYATIAAVFLSASWIALNHLDNRAEDYPLTRKKYLLLLFIIPFVASGYMLEILFFSRLDPNVITSCCGVLFSEGSRSIASSLASLPVRSTEIVFYSLSSLMIVAGTMAATKGGKPYTLLLSLLSGLFFFVSIAAIVSFISLYFYQMPTHHCPFDILQSHYYYVGYPLYAALFSGCFFGMMTGVVEPMKKIPSLSGIIPSIQKKWALIATIAIIVFLIITLFPIVFLPLRLEGY